MDANYVKLPGSTTLETGFSLNLTWRQPILILQVLPVYFSYIPQSCPWSWDPGLPALFLIKHLAPTLFLRSPTFTFALKCICWSCQTACVSTWVQIATFASYSLLWARTCLHLTFLEIWLKRLGHRGHTPQRPCIFCHVLKSPRMRSEFKTSL